MNLPLLQKSGPWDGQVIERILPSQVRSSESFGGNAAAELFPQECAFIARATESRRREFATARSCARAALARLGRLPAPVLPGPGGAPQWPDGVTGSITHCPGPRRCGGFDQGYRIAGSGSGG